MTGRRDGKTLDQNYVLIFHICDSKVTEVWEAWPDGAAWDEFWS